MKKNRLTSPFCWVPTLYFAEGIPAAVICEVSIVVFIMLGWSAARTASLVSLLGLVWVFKLLWAPAVDSTATKKKWIVVTQLLLGATFLLSSFFLTPAKADILFLLFAAGAVLSATFDIACDGFYIIGLDKKEQAFYSGWRSVFYRCAMVAANGGIVALAAKLGNSPQAWQSSFMITGIVFIVLAVLHTFILPGVESGCNVHGRYFAAFIESFKNFISRRDLLLFLTFFLCYRFAEAQLTVVSKVFLLDGNCGAGMTLERYSLAVGTVGIAAMLAGGVLGGMYISRVGLRKSLIPMAMALNIPDVLYLLWSFATVESLFYQTLMIAVEQAGYGFGFTGYMLVMIRFADGSGNYKTSHFALLTGVMILGLRLPGMFSGWLLENIPQICGMAESTKYQLFFTWVMIATLVSFGVTLLVRRKLSD